MTDGAAAGGGLSLVSAADRADVAAFLTRAARVDDSGVLRLSQRGDGRVGLWVRTGFDVLATRSVFGTVSPGDVIADLAALAASLKAGDDPVSTGFALPAAWRGALPAENGFSHLDDVPATELIALARKGSELAREESGPLGPAQSLLDQSVIDVTGPAPGGPGEQTVGISMRAVFALTAMDFARDADEPVRIRVAPAWIRIDGRFGSVYQRRETLGLSVR